MPSGGQQTVSKWLASRARFKTGKLKSLSESYCARRFGARFPWKRLVASSSPKMPTSDSFWYASAVETSSLDVDNSVRGDESRVAKSSTRVVPSEDADGW